MVKADTFERKNHHHRRKFTEGLLNNEVIMTALNIKAGQTVLDAGCGNGYMSKIFSDKVSRTGKVYALDPDKYFIEILRNETKGTNIEAMEGDITIQTKLKRSSIDLIYISTVIHGFSQRQMQGFIHETNRLLKTDALLAIVEIEKKETPFGPPVKLRFSPEELKGIIHLSPVDTIQVGQHFYMQIFRNREN
ncbi:MAG: class I SAM-dependent methyltransferase [Promethearchaeota archaeon]